MRVSVRLRREQDGAVLMIVAISLIVLIGMLVLTVDLGRMVAVRREMVRGADAAALAAAQQCAMGNGSSAATAAATDVAGTNHNGASLSSPLVFVPAGECDTPTLGGSKLVTVNLTTSVDMFFAPIFGVSSGAVTAQATAMWATPAAVPIPVNAVPLQICRDAIAQGQTQCTLEYDSDQFQEPRWGILDLSRWGDSGSCPQLDANVLKNIVSSGGIWPLPKPVPDYDCLNKAGNMASVWQLLEGHTYYFPIIDIPNSYLANGNLVSADPNCGRGPGCRIVSAWVTGFVLIKVLSVQPGNPETLTVQIVPQSSTNQGQEIRLVN